MDLKTAVGILEERYEFDKGTFCDDDSDFGMFVKAEMDAVETVLNEIKKRSIE